MSVTNGISAFGQRGAQQHRDLADPLCLREADVVLAQHLEQRVAHEQREPRVLRQREDDHRQDEVREIDAARVDRARVRRAAGRQPPELDREEVQRQQPDPERRRGGVEVARRPHEPVEERAAERRGQHAEHEPADEHEHERAADERDRRAEPRHDLARDGLAAGDDRVAHVALGEVRDPAAEALVERLIEPPRVRDLGLALGADLALRADVRVDGIERRDLRQRERERRDGQQDQRQDRQPSQDELEHEAGLG